MKDTSVVGTVAFLGLFAAGSAWAVPHVEADLTESTLAVLTEASAPVDSVSFSGRDGTVRLFSDVEDRDALAQMLRNQPGVRKVRILLTEARGEDAPPVIVDETRTDISIVLTSERHVSIVGTVASHGQREQLERAAAALVGPAAVENLAEVDVNRAGASSADEIEAAVRTLQALVDDLVIDAHVELAGGVLAVRARTAGDDAADALAARVNSIAVGTGFGRDIITADVRRIRTVTPSEQASLLADGLVQITEALREAGYFSADAEAPDPESAQIIQLAVQLLQRYPTPDVEAIGHTDANGLELTNQLLSEQRAKALIDHFIQAGVDPARLSSSGRGESVPIAPNSTADGRARNRRVEFVTRVKG